MGYTRDNPGMITAGVHEANIDCVDCTHDSHGSIVAVFPEANVGLDWVHA